MSLSPVPDVGQVARQTSRNDEQSINPHGIAGAGKTRGEAFGRHGDAAQSILVERPCRCLAGRSLLYLDERDRPAPTSDDVDFAAWYASAPS